MTPITPTIPIGGNTVNPTTRLCKLLTNPRQIHSQMDKHNRPAISRNHSPISDLRRVMDTVMDLDKDQMADNGINILVIMRLDHPHLDRGGRFNNSNGTLYHHI